MNRNNPTANNLLLAKAVAEGLARGSSGQVWSWGNGTKDSSLVALKSSGETWSFRMLSEPETMKVKVDAEASKKLKECEDKKSKEKAATNSRFDIIDIH